MRLIVDGSNVMGSRPDGWWRDRPAARRRLVGEIDAQATAVRARLAEGASLVVVFDGRPHDVAATAVAVRFAPDADDAITALAQAGDVVVTSDRALADRVAERGAMTVGASRLLRLLEPGRHAPS